MKIKKLAIILLSTLFMIQLTFISVFAASGNVYIFTYTWSDLNTRPSASNTVLRHLWDMGYDAGEYLNNRADEAYSVMCNSKIWIMASHGDPGVVYNLGTSNNKSHIYAAKKVSGNDRSITDLPNGGLDKTRLVMYMTCKSGLTSEQGFGNLVTITYYKGAKCVVGWNNIIYNNSSNDWLRLFFEKAQKERDVMWECFNHADYWTKSIYGKEDADLLNNRHEEGDISQYLYK